MSTSNGAGESALISDTYREQNRLLHESNVHYGTSGARMAKVVRQFMQALGTQSILDYGCGKRTLERALGVPISNYDPCILGLDQPPEACDIVVCSDVLEHVEPDHLDAVLDDLKRVTRKVGLFTACTVPALKHLPDGRNAHLIVESQEWWVQRIQQRFQLKDLQVKDQDFLVVVRPRA